MDDVAECLIRMEQILSDYAQRSAEDNGGYPDIVRAIPGFVVVASADENSESSLDIYSQTKVKQWLADIEQCKIDNPDEDMDFYTAETWPNSD